MRDDVLGAIRGAVGGTFEILGEMGREGDQAVAFLARENNTGGLVALKLEQEEPSPDSDLSLTVRRELDSTIPAQSERCPSCQATVRSWARFCPGCSQDLSGNGQAETQGRDQRLAEARKAAAGRYELLGEMPRAEGGRPVIFARKHDTGEVVALRVERSTSGEHLAMNVTQMLRAVRPGEAGTAPRAPAVRVQSEPARLTQPSAVTPTQPTGNPAPSAALVNFCPACGTEYEAGVWFCPRDGSSVRPKFTGGDLVGRIVAGRYRVLRKIGEGGMGQVYYAEHVRINKPFALKIMNPALKNDPESIGRFGREAAHASRIDHPNVATVHDFGETEDGMIFLAMEYAEGQRLAEVMTKEGALPPARAAEIGRQIADALSAAHEQGIMHRDLKPDNVILVHRGDREIVKVVDFGIAKNIESAASQRLTRTGFVVGTPKYMSPEQLIADPIDGRSDIYSLGCVMYEMLVGEPAFAGPTGELMITNRLTEKAPSARAKNPRVPEELDRIVLRSLARSPNDRFAQAAEMRDALAALAAHTPPARPAEPKPAPAAAPASKSPRAVQPVVKPKPARITVRSTPETKKWAAVAGAALLLVIVVLVVQSGGDTPATPAETDEKGATVAPSADAGRGSQPAAPVQPPPAPAVSRETAAVATNTSGNRQPSTQPEQNPPVRSNPPATRTQAPPVTSVRPRPDTVALNRSATQQRVATPVTPTAPSAAALDSVRDMLARATRLKTNGDYAAAFAFFRQAQARITNLRAAFPATAAVTTLNREYAEQLRSTVNACQAFREVRISLGLQPPDCSAGGN